MENVKETKNFCAVTMDGETRQSSDFVAVLSKENGDASILYQTDALTLGMAVKMIAKEYVRCRNELTDEEKASIDEVLGEAFVFDAEEENSDEQN